MTGVPHVGQHFPGITHTVWPRSRHAGHRRPGTCAQSVTTYINTMSLPYRHRDNTVHIIHGGRRDLDNGSSLAHRVSFRGKIGTRVEWVELKAVDVFRRCQMLLDAVGCCLRPGQLARLYTTRRTLLRVVHTLFLCTLLCPTTITVSIHGSPVYATTMHVASGFVYRFPFRSSDRDRTSCSKPTSRRTSGNCVAPRLIYPCIITHPTTCLHSRENGERDLLPTSLLFWLFVFAFSPFPYRKANCRLDFQLLYGSKSSLYEILRMT